MQGSIRLGKCPRIVSDAIKSIFWGPCMAREMPKISFGSRLQRASNRKRRKSRHGTLPPRLQKYAKTRGFRNIFEKKGRAQCTLDNTETQKTRLNAWFSMSFETRTPPASSRKPFGAASWLGKSQKLRFGSPETPTRFASTCKKTRENAWFLQCFTKIE